MLLYWKAASLIIIIIIDGRFIVLVGEAEMNGSKQRRVQLGRGVRWEDRPDLIELFLSLAQLMFELFDLLKILSSRGWIVFVRTKHRNTQSGLEMRRVRRSLLTNLRNTSRR